MASASILNTSNKIMYAWTGTNWIPLNTKNDLISSIRWTKTVSGGQTTLSGLDDNNVTLSYNPGYEQLYLNGILLVRGQDYTASDGLNITGLAALPAGGVIEILSFEAIAIGDTYTQLQSDNRFIRRSEVSDYTEGVSYSFDITPLDDLTSTFDGIENRYYPKYQGTTLTINNPYRLLLTINGIIQSVDFPEYVWGSDVPRNGFMIDYEGYIAFTEVPPAGSVFDAKIMPGTVTTTKTKVYPFRPLDILLGA